MNEIVAMLAINLALCLVLTIQHEAQRRERREWAEERRRLVDRAIARHTGEVVALDRHERDGTRRSTEPPVLVEGLS